MEKSKFRFAIIRYIPNPLRDEPVNVGILLQEVESGQLGVRVPDNLDRLERLPRDTDITLLDLALEALQSEVEHSLYTQVKYGTDDFFVNFSRKYRNRIQFTSPRPILAESLQGTLSHLFETYVGESAAQVKSRGYGHHQLRSAIKRVFTAHHLIGEIVQEGVKFKGSNWPEIEVDFAFQNGSPNVIQAISLDLKEDDRKEQVAKTWALNFREIMEGSGVRKSCITAVVHPPLEQHSAVFRSATKLLEHTCGNLVINNDTNLLTLASRVRAIAHPWSPSWVE